MEQKLITVDEAAKITGMSPSWWRAAVNGRKPLPPVRVHRLGGAIRIHHEDLLAWIDGDDKGQPQTAQRKKPGRPRKKKPENN